MPRISKLLSALLAALLMAPRLIRSEPPAHGVRPSNVLGGLEQHASFSFVRPGLTQTAYAFNGPSSHQAFSSSIGDPHLAQRVLPSVAHALAYRNPGLGYAPVGASYVPGPPQAPLTYQQQQLDYQQQQALSLAYQHQLQQYQQYQQYQQQQAYSAEYAQQLQAQPATQQSVEQAHLGRLLAARLAAPQVHSVAEAVPEQIQLQQQQQQQTANLLGVAYSAAPSVAHVKVNGNGYKFDF